ncbi:hypothetical protein EVAR_52942_1 [Eumeta japonica]|uniref:Uncharacterized protein n=1 Tax=Eumeta variegata TaxID=151549 RepID=A0A4C1XRY0_EUMVA|nr:hypothetical protein EVAR_52942_1 [Eumeta japonica]
MPKIQISSHDSKFAERARELPETDSSDFSSDWLRLMSMIDERSLFSPPAEDWEVNSCCERLNPPKCYFILKYTRPAC